MNSLMMASFQHWLKQDDRTLPTTIQVPPAGGSSHHWMYTQFCEAAITASGARLSRGISFAVSVFSSVATLVSDSPCCVGDCPRHATIVHNSDIPRNPFIAIS